jgi:hypothetical protein
MNVTVNDCVSPVYMLADGGEMYPELISDGTTVTMTGVLVTVMPFSVALSISSAEPALFPATKSIEAPTVLLRFPTCPLSDHEYWMPPEHWPPEHVGVAVNGTICPGYTVAEEGLIPIPVNDDDPPLGETTIVTGPPPRVIPWRVAFTKTVVDPSEFPAMNTAVEPELERSSPMLLFVIDQE